jgi:hypothetical protein
MHQAELHPSQSSGAFLATVTLQWLRRYLHSLLEHSVSWPPVLLVLHSGMLDILYSEVCQLTVNCWPSRKPIIPSIPSRFLKIAYCFVFRANTKGTGLMAPTSTKTWQTILEAEITF